MLACAIRACSENTPPTELAHDALIGSFREPSIRPTHISPLMTLPKKNSEFRRVIMDLSWPAGESVNDGLDRETYIDGPATIKLPTVEYMENLCSSWGQNVFSTRRTCPGDIASCE